MNLCNRDVLTENFVIFMKYLRNNSQITFPNLYSKDIPQCRTNHEYFKNIFFLATIKNGLCLISIFEALKTLTLKRLGGQFDPSPLGFSKNVSSKEWMKPWLSVTFDIIVSHIFPENFIEIPQLVLKLWRISLSKSGIFIDFHQFSGFFDISLLQRN